MGDQFVFGVDLDGVVADFYGALRPLAAEWVGRTVEELPVENLSFGLSEWGLVDHEDYERLHRFAVVDRGIFERLEPIPGAAPALRRLSRDGVRVRIITHRLYVKYTHQTSIGQTVSWLDHHGVPYWDICFMREKGAVGADLYVDDAPHNVESLRAENHEAIVFSGPVNLTVPDPRADDWPELEAMVRERYERWTANRRQHGRQ